MLRKKKTLRGRRDWDNIFALTVLALLVLSMVSLFGFALYKSFGLVTVLVIGLVLVVSGVCISLFVIGINKFLKTNERKYAIITKDKMFHTILGGTWWVGVFAIIGLTLNLSIFWESVFVFCGFCGWAFYKVSRLVYQNTNIILPELYRSRLISQKRLLLWASTVDKDKVLRVVKNPKSSSRALALAIETLDAFDLDEYEFSRLEYMVYKGILEHNNVTPEIIHTIVLKAGHSIVVVAKAHPLASDETKVAAELRYPNLNKSFAI